MSAIVLDTASVHPVARSGRRPFLLSPSIRSFVAWGRLVRRNAGRRRALRAALGEVHEARLLADIGIEATAVRSRDRWFEAILLHRLGH